MSDAASVWQSVPNQMKQLALKLPQWGGKERGSGAQAAGAATQGLAQAA